MVPCPGIFPRGTLPDSPHSLTEGSLCQVLRDREDLGRYLPVHQGVRLGVESLGWNTNHKQVNTGAGRRAVIREGTDDGDG